MCCLITNANNVNILTALAETLPFRTKQIISIHLHGTQQTYSNNQNTLRKNEKHTAAHHSDNEVNRMKSYLFQK